MCQLVRLREQILKQLSNRQICVYFCVSLSGRCQTDSARSQLPCRADGKGTQACRTGGGYHFVALAWFMFLRKQPTGSIFAGLDEAIDLLATCICFVWPEQMILFQSNVYMGTCTMCACLCVHVCVRAMCTWAHALCVCVCMCVCEYFVP